MTALQKNSLQKNPNDLNLVEVACYQRLINASVERVWENVRDWEHLPWLHESSFSYVSLDTQGEWGWRTWASEKHTSHVELCIDTQAQRYVARSYRKQQQVTEIWTSLRAEGAQTHISVTFAVPDIADADKTAVGQLYLDLYSRLWDEDEEMMQARQQQLTPAPAGPDSINLGPLQELLPRLPMEVRIRQHNYQVCAVAGELLVYPARCPHLLGPLSILDDSILDDSILDDSILNSSISDSSPLAKSQLDSSAHGRADKIHAQTLQVRCPWHGYVFDIRSGACLSPANAACRLHRSPPLQTNGASGDVILGVA